MVSFFNAHHEFRAVQGHITSTAAIYLPIARRAGVPVAIAHARSAGVDKGLKGRLTRWLRRDLSQKADYLFTCSELAGVSVFGEQAVREGRTVFIPNAIDCGAFSYGEKVRERMRRELGVSGKYVIGHVGRFHYAKNHEYLLRVFAALVGGRGSAGEEGKCGKREYVLLLLGEGGGMDAARELAKELGIWDRVYFLGNHSNISDYYQAMDYFVYPSRFEGLPGTVVEAQAAGLRVLMSDTICREVAVTELVHVMSIQEDARAWAAYIDSHAQYGRRSYASEMAKAGFDVQAQAQRMMKFYESGEWE